MCFCVVRSCVMVLFCGGNKSEIGNDTLISDSTFA